MPALPLDDTLSPPLRAFLELFDRELSEVKFPGVDADSLAGFADRVRVHAEALRQAEAARAAAEGLLEESQEALLQHAHRALAYLRVYAEEHPELHARVEALSLPRPARRAVRPEGHAPVQLDAGGIAPKRRGRPPKAKSDALFDTETSEAPPLG